MPQLARERGRGQKKRWRERENTEIRPEIERWSELERTGRREE
jgi:hypothetical protein